jgi:predicted MFS family arabinose efflux permease
MVLAATSRITQLPTASIAGGIVHRFGYHAGFLFLAAVAAAAFILLWIATPETRHFKDRSAS